MTNVTAETGSTSMSRGGRRPAHGLEHVAERFGPTG